MKYENGNENIIPEDLKEANWKIENGELTKRFQFVSFEKSMGFVEKAATIAESMNHHPRIIIDYNKVDLSLISHDMNAITEKDFAFAKKIERLA